MERVARQANRLKVACRKPDAEWGELSLALTELADAIESPRLDDYKQVVQEHLVPLADDLAELLRSIRSKLVADTCEQLCRIVRTTRIQFKPLANMLIDALANTAKGSSIAIREPGFKLFSDISEYSRYDLQHIHRNYRSSPQERVRVLLLDQLQVVLAYWRKAEIEPFYSDFVDLMHRGMRDPSGTVRAACRQTFCSFSDLWMDRAEELLNIPTAPARELLAKEKPHAAITKVLQEKFNSGAAKQRGRDDIGQRRSAFRRQGSAPSGGREEDFFIEVTESPRKPVRRPSDSETGRRGASPGHGVSPVPFGRGQSPPTMGSTARSASPIPNQRVPSPRIQPRSASPSKRAASPGRSLPGTRSSPGRSSNGHVVSPPSALRRPSEFDRYLSMTSTNGNGTNQSSTMESVVTASYSRSSKRVSITEPSTETRSNDVAFEPSTPARYQSLEHGSSAPVHRVLPQSDSELVDLEAHIEFDDRHDVSVGSTENPSFAFHPNKTSDLPREVTSEQDSFSSSRQEPESELPDTFLDQPIPSSTPAPTPRSPANVTLRARRRIQFDGGVEGETEVKSTPVSEDLVPENPFDHHAEEPTPTPPAVSLGSLFFQNSMHEPPSQTGDGMGDAAKENSVSDNKENLLDNHRYGSDTPDEFDALANLDIVRAGLRTLREQVEAGSPLYPAHSGASRLTGDLARKENDRLSDTALVEPERREHQVRSAPPNRPPMAQQRPISTMMSQTRNPSLQSQHNSSSQLSPVEGPPTVQNEGNLAPVSTDPAHHPDFIREPPRRIFPPQQPRQTRRSPVVPNPAFREEEHLSKLPSINDANLGGLQPAARIVDANVGSSQVRDEDMHGSPKPPLQPASSVPAGISQGEEQPNQAQPGGDLFDDKEHLNTMSNSANMSVLKRQVILQPKPQRVESSVLSKMLLSFCLMVGAIFGISGLIQAATKVRDAYEYHQALLSRINHFESSIVESYESVRKMDEKYAIWSEYVRELTEQDENHALRQLESIQQEVEKWQLEMKSDLLEFKRSLSGDIIDAALAPLRDTNTTENNAPTVDA